MNMLFSLIPVVGIIVLLVVVGLVAAKLYTRASQERAFVRTGLGGQKVVLSGGALVLPIFHEVIWVNRNTLRLEVRRGDEQSLITQDRLRVDVSAEFYVRVAQSAEAIATAAQTLGNRTNDPNTLKALVEGKFVDALRAAAAAMTMEQLHEKRAEFVQNVKQAVTEDLTKNGLELEAVSLTGLNQTQKKYFDPSNAFDAEGLLKLTREIETRNKARNDVEQETAVAIEQKNLTATQQQLQIKRQREEATLQTAREIAQLTAEQQAAVAATEAEGRRRAEEANLLANQQVAQKRIESERVVAEAEANKKKAVETAQIAASTEVQLAAQGQNIIVANKSKEEAAARAAADLARAEAVRAEEAVETARRVEVANREKAVTLVRAEERAREDSIGITVAAEAERDAAEARAAALRQQASGERDAALMRAEAVTAEGEAEANALRARNEAQNLLSPELIAQQVKLQLLSVLPAIIEKSVEPLKNIDSIRIAEVGGLNGGGSANGSGGTAVASGGLGNEVVNSALRYRAAQPVVDALLAEVGLKAGGDLNHLVGSAAQLAGVALGSAPVAAAAEAPALDDAAH